MEKEQQHTVSKSYLENFSNEKGLIWVLDTNDKIFNASPYNVLKERHFYSLTLPNGKKDFTVEDALSGIEGDYVNVFKNKLLKNLFLTSEERIIVSVFIATLMIRTRPHRDSMKDSLQEIKKWMEGWKKEPSQPFKSVIPSSGKTISIDDLNAGLQNFDEHHSLSILSTTPQIASLIYNMKWSIWINKKYGFVTSDDPVVILRPASIKKYGENVAGSRPGLRYKDVELTIPLSRNRLLLAGWILNDDSYIEVDDEKAENIDHRTITHSRDRIVSNSEDKLKDIKLRYCEKPYKSKNLNSNDKKF